MFCVRKLALKTGFVFILDLVFLDAAARSNYQREINDFFI